MIKVVAGWWCLRKGDTKPGGGVVAGSGRVIRVITRVIRVIAFSETAGAGPASN